MVSARITYVPRIITFLVAFCFICTTTQAKYSGGSGTVDDPYQIATAEDLMLLGDSLNDYDKHFIMTNDIDLDPNLPGRKVFDNAVIGVDWMNPFTGVFNGNGHTILHLTIRGESNLGLFGRLNPETIVFTRHMEAIVSNLHLEAINVHGTGDCIGGLVGFNHGIITACQVTGTVSGTHYVGGLAGNNYFSGSITMSHSMGVVSGNQNVGGLVGMNDGSIATSYSTCSVNGNYCVGGLVGRSSSSIATSYSTGIVSGNESVGGLVGENYGSIVKSFWDMGTSGQTNSSGGTGLTTTEMQNVDTYINAGWDFVDETLNGTCDYWQISQGDYPKLRCLAGDNPVMPEGLGTVDAPYLIRNARDLGTVWFEPLAHYRLESSLDLSGITWSVAVIPWFGGTFDGNGNVISNLQVRGSGFLGLFGQLCSSMKVSNLGLEAIDISGTGDYVGGLVGYNWYSSITRSYSAGIVSGKSNVGGLVGFICNDSSISACYSNSSVSGDEQIGGLVGKNNSSGINTSYSTGMVDGDSDVGGLVGQIIHGDIYSSVWDIQTSGIAGSDGGVGLTTAEMMNPNMLGLNGFTNDPNWILDAGNDYPRLAWEGTSGDIIPEPIIDWMGGHGTEQNPYRINTADQMILLSKASILWDKSFVLGANINLDPNLPGGRVFGQAIIPQFTGIFDGNNHVISNFVITGNSHLGFFGQVEIGSMIRNLGILNVNVDGSGNHIGSLAGQNEGDISNCYSAGTVRGDRSVGGLVGSNNYYGNITRSYSTGTVSGTHYIGGLTGSNEGSITMSYSISTVTGEGETVGGLVASNNGNITNSYSISTVSGNYVAGGLVGENWDAITRSYSIGTVSGDWYAGGLVGINYYGNITASYSTTVVSGDYYIGGLAGENDWLASITSSFWDVETGGLTNMCGRQDNDATGCDDSYGKTTAEMQTANTFLEVGWDFVDETNNGTEDIWWIDEGRDYPHLWWELVPGN